MSPGSDTHASTQQTHTCTTSHMYYCQEQSQLIAASPILKHTVLRIMISGGFKKNGEGINCRFHCNLGRKGKLGDACMGHHYFSHYYTIVLCCETA